MEWCHIIHVRLRTGTLSALQEELGHIMRKPVPYANNKGTDQPAHPHSLISTFVIHCLDSITAIVAIFEIPRFLLVSIYEAQQAGLSLKRSQTTRQVFPLCGLTYLQVGNDRDMSWPSFICCQWAIKAPSYELGIPSRSLFLCSDHNFELSVSRPWKTLDDLGNNWYGLHNSFKRGALDFPDHTDPFQVL